MQVHVISLNNALRRRKSIEGQLKSLNLSYEIFDAVNGSYLTFEEIKENFDLSVVAKFPKWLTPTALGCAMSHFGVYRKISNSKYDWHLVLEDDVILDPKISSIIDHLESKSVLYNDHLLLLYTISTSGPVYLSYESEILNDTFTTRKVLSHSIAGAGAYILHKNTAKRILEKNKIMAVASDSWQYYMEQGCFSQIDCIYPFLAKPGFFESTIGYIDKDSLLYKIKHFIDKYRLPGLYQLLKINRKMIWLNSSKVVFCYEPK